MDDTRRRTSVNKFIGVDAVGARCGTVLARFAIGVPLDKSLTQLTESEAACPTRAVDERKSVIARRHDESASQKEKVELLVRACPASFCSVLNFLVRRTRVTLVNVELPRPSQSKVSADNPMPDRIRKFFGRLRQKFAAKRRTPPVERSRLDDLCQNRVSR